jgi:hypothetical protein
MSHFEKSRFIEIGSAVLIMAFGLNARSGVNSWESTYEGNPTICTKTHDINQVRCVTAAVSAAAGTASGIYSLKKFGRAKIIDESETKTIFSDHTGNNGRNGQTLNNMANNFSDGDRIITTHILSEIENRSHHISEMERAASSADSSASYHRTISYTAMKDIHAEVLVQSAYTDSRGVYHPARYERKKVGEKPDYVARMLHASQADSYEKEARDYRKKAASAKGGGAVPRYEFETTFDEKEGTSKTVKTFVKERLDRGGSILKMTRLPAESFARLKGLLRKGYAGVAGVAVGAAVAVEEIVSGQVAKRIDGNPATKKSMDSIFQDLKSNGGQ